MIVTENGKLVRKVTLSERTLIGRSRMNDLCLENAYLSRHHAAIVRGDSGYFLKDLNSVNGVLLNGEMVEYAPVNDGDVLRIGPYRIKLDLPDRIVQSGAEEESAAGLADTQVMPTPVQPEPARLKVIK